MKWKLIFRLVEREVVTSLGALRKPILNHWKAVWKKKKKLKKIPVLIKSCNWPLLKDGTADPVGAARRPPSSPTMAFQYRVIPEPLVLYRCVSTLIISYTIVLRFSSEIQISEIFLIGLKHLRKKVLTIITGKYTNKARN